MAASRLQTELASRARLEHEAFKLAPQQLAAGRMFGDCHLSAPHGRAEALDQPRTMDFLAFSLGKIVCDASTAIVYAARCTDP